MGKKPRFHDGQRRRLATKGKRLGRQTLDQFASLVTPNTLLAWHRRLVAKKYDGSAVRKAWRPTSALNRTNTYAYDGMGRRITHTLPAGQSEGFVYDTDGNVLYNTNFNGVVIANLYDSMNRLTNRSSVFGYNVTFAYSLTGQRTNMTDASGTTSYSYDVRDRLLLKQVSWNNGPSLFLNYLYDANGTVTNIWETNGVNLAYAYDPLGRLTNVMANGSAAASYGFDLAGNLQAMRYGNGVTNLCQYDSLNRLTNMAWKLNTSTLASFYYELGLTGNRTNLVETITNGTRTFQWQYDKLYRLTNENITAIGNVGYAYDAVGNRTNRTSTITQLSTGSSKYGTNDWLATDAYDSNGNTLWSTNGPVQGPYYYDVENRLTNYANTVYLTYDGDCSRVRKTLGSTNTFYLVDDRNPSGYAQVLEEWTASGGTTNLSRVYNYGLSLINQRTPNSSTNYFIFDGHGSTRMLTDTGGGLVNAFAYDAYGTLIASNGVPQALSLYCGQQFDPDLGLYYDRARYLNTGTGRFWSADNTEGDNEDPLSLHKYIYGADNPVDGSDPSGNDDIGDVLGAMDISSSLDALSLPTTSIAGTKTISRLQPRTLYVRSFAPWKTFGGGFGGDNRSFTTAHVPGGAASSAPGANSRITSIIKFQPFPLSIISQTAYSDPSSHAGMTSKTATSHVAASVSGSKLQLKMWGANPLVPLAPDIDEKWDMFVDPVLTQTLYHGELKGDAFPDAEVFIVDPSEHATVLDNFTTKGGRETGPFHLLPGDNNRPMGSFSVWINN